MSGAAVNRIAAAVVTLVLAVLMVKVLVIDRLHDMAGAAQQAAVTLSGTVHPQTYKHEPLVGNVWTATLVTPAGQIINLTNDGDDGCMFEQNITDGDQVSIAAGADPSSLAPADVTVNGTNLGNIPVPDFAGGC